MGQLIHDVYDHLTVKYGEKYRERRNLNNQLAKVPKKNKPARFKISDRLAKVRKIINDIPIRCNKYQVVIKGKAAALQFFSWLKTPSSEMNHPDWLPEKLPGWEWQPGNKPKAENTQYFTALYQSMANRRFWRRLIPPSWVEFTDSYWNSVKHDYENQQEYEPYSDAPSFEDLQELGYI